MKRTDIETLVNEFKDQSKPDDRYTSFDYCYNYFLTTDNLTKDIEKSCLVIGFYLASWGMLRGSSFLLQKSVKHFQPAIKYIETLDRTIWEIDVDTYNEENIQIIIKTYKDIKDRLIQNGNRDLTLITKLLLGVFGFIPAFDNFFATSFSKIYPEQCSFTTVNVKSLRYIKQFYDVNKETIDSLSSRTFTKDFITEKVTKTNYPKAKIIDMYGFILGSKKPSVLQKN